jgi:hypothetical protein
VPRRDPAAYRAPLPVLSEPAVTFWVAPDGGDGADGSKARPFRSLEEARDTVRSLKKSSGGTLPKGGVRIVVRGGTYPVRSTFVVTERDAGTASAPVVYQAATGEVPRLSGGVCITAWQPVTDATVRRRLNASVRDRVVQADLKGLGVQDWGDATALRRRPELFAGGVPQILARWPNDGFAATGDVLGKETFTVWGSIKGCRDGVFRYVEDRPGRWLEEPDIRLHGYWFWDWYDQHQTVASIDPAAKTMTLRPPYSSYGYRKGQRYYALNLLCELDAPGEWYLDRAAGRIYWLPPEGAGGLNPEAILSVLAAPFIRLDGAEHVLLNGFVLEDGRADGIHVRSGSNCVIAGCTVRRLGGDAIVITGGSHHGIFGCRMETLGCGGARIAGGDRRALTPGNHWIENCTVSHVARLKRTYAPAVHLDGCGNRIAHNLFERIASSAMRIEGNDHVIELNAIRHVVEESDDQGGLDMWGNPLYRGVVIRWNHWRDITGGTHCGAAGVRLDDMISAVTVYGNVFERCGAVRFGAVQIHGGKGNVVEGNVFLDCFAGLSFSRWGAKRWLDSIARFRARAGAPPLATRYPALARLTEGADVNIVSRNVFARTKPVFLRDGGLQQTTCNVIADDSFRLADLRDDAAVRSDPRLRRILFEPIPIDEIGPYEHPWRSPDTK